MFHSIIFMVVMYVGWILCTSLGVSVTSELGFSACVAGTDIRANSVLDPQAPSYVSRIITG